MNFVQGMVGGCTGVISKERTFHCCRRVKQEAVWSITDVVPYGPSRQALGMIEDPVKINKIIPYFSWHLHMSMCKSPFQE